MNNKFIILSLLLALAASQTYSISSCTCAQLLSEGDCLKNVALGCAWDTTKKTCAVSTTTVTPTVTYAAYCDPFSQTDCPKTNGCAWVSSKCTFFTGCTAFNKITDDDCKAISNKCITDGVHCVQLDSCSTYLKATSCVKNALGALCYWDTTNNTCVDANTCDKLPTSLTTDTDCRAQISTCTTKTGGGCVDSGTNCSDQTLEIQCVWNKTKLTACYWDGAACKDRICENAPTTNVTDDACKAFRTDGTCTTKANGGCVNRTTCNAATIQAACVTNSSGSKCYWNGTACVDLTCGNAPSTLTSNSACAGFLGTCITTGSGCITNGACSVATIQAACVKNSSQVDCIWDTTCKEKTCANAPASNTTHELCTQYLSTCTVKSGGSGCQPRTCANAPTSIVTNDACETYLPRSNCITKNGGGCTVNGTCSSITAEVACVRSLLGVTCFWDGTCKDKICTNAPTTNTTHPACQSFLATCTVNSSGAGCVDKTCENSLTSELCTTDLNSKPCIFKGLCYPKQCALASTSYTTYDDCHGYLGSCTLSNTGSGCVPIPLKCEAILIQGACKLKKTQSGYADCGWNGSACIDKGCTTIDKTVTTTTACNLAISGCVSANPVNNVVSGCMDLPTTCAARKTQDNCETGSSLICIWNSTTNACVQKTCLTANVAGTTGVLSSFSALSCSTYLSGTTCLLNNTADGCTPQAACTSFTKSDNCITGAKTGGGDCYWTGSNCVDKVCTNIALTSHTNCNSTFPSCTVNSAKTSCQAFAACNTYTLEEQCVQNASGQLCFWTGTQCRNQVCTDAPSTASYQTDDSCKALKVADTCTVISRVNKTGCFSRVACTAYLEETQCVKDNNNADCLWHNSKCWLKSTFTCANISGATATTGCENVLYSCKWDSGTSACVAKVCADYTTQNGKTGGDAVTTADHCSALNSSCTINKATSKACQTKQALCSSYSGADACTVATEGTCIFDGTNCVAPNTACASFTGDNTACTGFRPFCKKTSGSGACESKTCGDLATSQTFTLCQAFDSSCSVNSGGDCIVIQATCAEYTGSTAEADCVQSRAGLCHWNGTLSTPACEAATCETITLTTYSDDNCKAAKSNCIANRAASACQTIQTSCSSYSLANCTRTATTECIGTSDSGTGTCVSVTASTACASIFLGSSNYNQANCTAKNSSCTNNSTTACQAKTCANKVSPASYSDCQSWLTSCTYNNNSSSPACVSISAKCNTQSTSACYWSSEGDCVVLNSQCVKKTCDNAPASNDYNDHSECTGYLSTCTVARTGGCISRLPSCSSYTQELQCKNNASGAKCYWSALNLTCLDLTCANLDQSASFSNHSQCSAAAYASLKCTVRAASGAVANGCMAAVACSQYTISDQCYYNSSGAACQWNTNVDPPVCVDKSCTTAPKSTVTHADCQLYYTANSASCTVAAVAGSNGSPTTVEGCQPVANCSSYIHEEQCKINTTGGLCGWNGSVCADFSCTTAPASESYNSDSKCQTYKTGCTVDQSGSGCMALLATCEAYQIEGNCVKNLNGALCYWNSTTSACVTRTCENAPDSITDATGCDNYLSGCTLDSVKCKTKICEDFALATDALCKAALATCTTDGTKCVVRGTCVQALNEAGCVTSSSGQQCQWVAANGNVAAYCTVKTCSTAPVASYTTESQCAAYFTNCTTKSGGGCTLKSTCSAATVEGACTTALDGTKCQWDNNACRNKDCQDYSGDTHSTCQAISTSCTAGANGKCAKVKTCSNTTVRAACIQGTDGPCLWIAGYTNNDGTTGACFPYTSCKSLTWTTNTSCKLISSQCTTNGTNCLSVTLCSETNTSGGCVTGYDGDCIQSVASLGSNDAPVCKAYTSCSDAFYATHAQCQVASSKCTTNGTTGCVPLASCSTYNQAGCFKNDKGVVLTSGAITSTGVCTWDTTTSACRDQSCADLTGITHSTCASQLSTCTSDGTKCLLKGACTSYTTQTACTTAVGSDGVCYWEVASATNNNTAKCRLLACTDIQNGTATNVCAVALSSCVSNGTACIAKANCSTYTTKTACNSGGLDGICVFTQSTATGAAVGTGTCALMTACTSANSDQVACQAAKDRCSWTAASGSGTNAVASACKTHTCATNQATNGACTRFLNWDKKTQQVCTLVSGVCTATDPSTLSSTDCFQVSGYTYTWNSSTSKCGVCTAVVVTPNNTDNNTNNNTDNGTTTDSGYILGLSTIIFGLIFQ